MSVSLVDAFVSSNNGGRAFAAPPGKAAGEGELWVNLGPPFSDNVQEVAYLEVLKPLCTKDQYDDLVRAVVKLMQEEAPKHPHQGCCSRCCGKTCACLTRVCAPCICIGGCLCCCCMPCIMGCVAGCAGGSIAGAAVVAIQISEATEKAQKLVEEKTQPWSAVVALKLVGNPEVGLLADNPAKDQHGQPLKGTVVVNGDTGETRSGFVWPPAGLNIIFNFKSDLHAAWPPVPGQAQMIGNGQ